MTATSAVGDRGTGGLIHFLRATREPVNGATAAVRIVYRSELVRENTPHQLDKYIADRAPLFYRSLSNIMADLRDGYFLTAFRTTLARLPTSASFRESHFGEIVAGIFAEEVLGLRRLYSKLTLLTAENANAYKMDLVMYDPAKDPIEIVFGEVKCSPKHASDGLPASHDGSCFADIFRSFNKYQDDDRTFDLTAARDHLSHLDPAEQSRIRAALKPYSSHPFRYAAFAVIDTSTYSEEEAQVLRTRPNSKSFEVDLVCLETFAPVADAVFGSLRHFLESGQTAS